MRYPKVLLAIIFVAIAAGNPAISTGQQRPVPVVLISIDGLKPEYVIEADRLGL